MINFRFEVSGFSFCSNKTYVFSDEFCLKRSLYKLQTSGKILEGAFITQSQFFDSLKNSLDFPLISPELRELVFWQACANEDSFEVVSEKAKRFFSFWREVNGLVFEQNEIEKILISNQLKRWNRQCGYREKYLEKIRSMGFADDEVESVEYSAESLYETSIVFYDCLNFTPKQANWLKNSEERIEFSFSFPEAIYDKERLCVRDFAVKQLEHFSFPRVEIKQYEDKFFMDAALVNDGVKSAYGNYSEPAFNVFGRDFFLKNRKSFRFLSALKGLITGIKNNRIPLEKLLSLVLVHSWKGESSDAVVIDKNLVLNLIDRQYKFLFGSEIKTEFLAFIKELSSNFDFFFSYLKKLDDSPIYLEKIDELLELTKTINFSPLQALDYFLSKNAKELVATNKNKVNIKPLHIKVSLGDFTAYNATEGFLNGFCKDGDFFSEEQKKNLGLLSSEQAKNIRKFCFLSLLQSHKNVTIYTYEEPINSIQIASVLEELRASDLDVEFTKYSDLDLKRLLSLILPSENSYDFGEETEFVFPYSGEKLDNFSYSEAKSLLENAESYYLNYVLKIREFNLPSRSIESNLLGEIAHKIFQVYLQKGKPENISEIAEKVLSSYSDKLPDNYHKLFFEKYTVETIMESLQYFVSEVEQAVGECEKNLEKYFPDCGITLRGRLDYLTENALFDFKTGSKNNLDPAQLEFYSLLAENLPACFYLVFEKEVVPFWEKRNYQPILSALKEKIRRVKTEGFKGNYDE